MKRWQWVVGLVGLAGLAFYLAWSWAGGHLGFPLDDAWIHQTYARNLVEYGQWAFIPGQPSAGSTAPLWTLLLAVGYGVGIPFRLWTYVLGGLCLAGTALLAARLAGRLVPDRRSVALLVGLACALEWHLVWAAGSGMETLLFTLLALALWNRVLDDSSARPFLTGLLGGALVLTRPEGILAVGLAIVGVALHGGKTPLGWRAVVARLASLTLGVALVVAPYLALNVHLSGTPWPNTFYAKQAEYGVLLAQPLLLRLWRVAAVGWTGGQVLLLPGLVWELWRAARGTKPDRRAAIKWLPLLWVAATVSVYALRLPVTYQHGRYAMPVLAPMLVLGAEALARFWQRSQGRRLAWVMARAWAASWIIIGFLFWFRGAEAYAEDVAIINTEMVKVARWLSENTEPEALVAAHDIGAIGYFGRRRLLDLAGLISPEVIPILRDEPALAGFLTSRGADYLATFPGWYPGLTAGRESIYMTGEEYAPAAGGENMAVYRWP